jgi:hypothetical protein
MWFLSFALLLTSTFNIKRRVAHLTGNTIILGWPGGPHEL